MLKSNFLSPLAAGRLYKFFVVFVTLWLYNEYSRPIQHNYIHPKGIAVTISGKLGDDAKKYQEKQVKSKISEIQK